MPKVTTIQYKTQNKSKQSLASITNKLLYILPVLAASLTLALGIAIYSLSTIRTTSAVAADKLNLTLQAESLSINLSTKSTTLNVAPTYEGVFSASTPVTINVDTVNRYGYNLVMTTTASTDLVGTTSLSGGDFPRIPTLADDNSGSGYDSTNFPINRWGYSVGDANYFPVTQSNTLRTTDGTNNAADRTSTVSFGTKLNTEVAGGNYVITLNFIATSNAPSNLGSFEAAFEFAGKVKYGTTSYYAMQDMNSNICSYVATPTTTTSAPSTQLIDTRDNKIYWISKLKDGNCWMTQNLDLNLDSSVALTNADTDLNSVTSWTPVRSTIDSTSYNNTASGASGGILTYNNGAQNGNFAPGFSNSTSPDMTVNANNSPYSADPGYRYVVPKEMSGSNTNWYDNGDTFYYCANQDTTCGGNSENGHYTIGNYYNFAAASATNNVETTLGGSANVVQNASMPDSICPKGWRLPIDKTTNNEFNTLLGSANYNVASSFNPQGLNAIRIAPLYFVRSGQVNGGALDIAGVVNLTWSSTISSSTNGYRLHFNSTDIYPADNENRLYGLSVRCLARTSISDITYMQEFATMTDAKKEEIKNTMTTGQAYQLIDNRDNEVYNVAKLADGNVWLLDNLRLDPATLLQQLTPANTNMDPSTPFTLPTSSTELSWTEPRLNTDYKNEIATTYDSSASGKIGVFYNYCAASAGTYCNTQTTASTDTPYDICPAGWNIPQIESGVGSYKYLSSIENSPQTALRLILSGSYSGINDRIGTSGDYVISKMIPSEPKQTYRLTTTDLGGFYPEIGAERNREYSVRCLLK
ncbi:hypothetical protein IKG68_00500 [Candidatus Saccharibacteria bacterium]|nr:hypothetical protein [Candidatus Saccharibacteria bacterium]